MGAAQAQTPVDDQPQRRVYAPADNRDNCFFVISKVQPVHLNVYEVRDVDTVLRASYPACVAINRGQKERSGDNKTPESSASETTSTDSGAESTDSNTESTDSGEGSEGGEEGGEGSEGGEELTGPTGDLVSCAMEFFGEKICDEVAKADEASLSAQCEAMGGTMNTAGGCKAEDYAAKCTCKKGNHYDSSCEGFTCND